MRAPHTEILNLRVPEAMRSALHAEARREGVKLSAATRTALAAGLEAIRARASNDPDAPPPAGPAAAMKAAA